MINKILFNKKKMLDALILASILIFFSLFTGSAKIMGTGFTLYAAILFWNLYLMWNSNKINFEDVIFKIDKEYKIAKNEKKYGKQFLYGITIPMMGIGCIMIIVIVISFFTIL